MESLHSVREVANRLQKSEETIKRWLRLGRFPNAFKENDKKGWQIPQQDMCYFLLQNEQASTHQNKMKDKKDVHSTNEEKIIELVTLAFQAVTMTSPTQSMINMLNQIGIRRTLEILLILRQSPQRVKNPEGFIRKAISKGWSPSTLPIKKERNVAKTNSNNVEYEQRKVPFYNWLEED